MNLADIGHENSALNIGAVLHRQVHCGAVGKIRSDDIIKEFITACSYVRQSYGNTCPGILGIQRTVVRIYKICFIGGPGPLACSVLPIRRNCAVQAVGSQSGNILAERIFARLAGIRYDFRGCVRDFVVDRHQLNSADTHILSTGITALHGHITCTRNNDAAHVDPAILHRRSPSSKRRNGSITLFYTQLCVLGIIGKAVIVQIIHTGSDGARIKGKGRT